MNGACELPALPRLRVDLAAGVRLLHPATTDYTALANTIAAELRGLGATVEVGNEADAAALTGTAGVIVLGNLMESALVRRLYFGGYDFTDFAFPGPGGFTLRTIRDPFGTGAHVLLAGGSDIAGVREAGQRLAARIRREGLALGYINEVGPGRWTTVAELEPAQFLADTDEVWQRVGASGSWEYMERIARCATGYLRTADERYLRLFRRELRHFMTHDVQAPNPEAPVMLHGRMYQLIMAWDLVQDHPLFSDEDRREFDAMFLHVARSPEGAAQIREVAQTAAVRMNHDTRSALDAFFVGRYFARRHGLAEAAEWLGWAERLFAPQLGSAKPVEDSWGHQWVASLHNTLVYALATGREDYLASAAFRAAAERALLAHGTEGPRVYLANCAAATGDSGWLSLEPDAQDFVRAAAQLRLTVPREPGRPAYFEEVLRSFVVDAAIRRRDDLLGVRVAPLDACWHRTIETPVYNPEGVFAVTASPEKGFDKIALREGWGAEDFYLLLDGISGGHHAFQDANCLVRLREGGTEWFVPAPGYQHSVSIRAQNGVQVTLNGAGPGRLHRYARRCWQGEKNGFMACASALEGLGDADWTRCILRRRGAWTLIIDRVTAKGRGEMLVERFWHPQGQVVLRGDGFDCMSSATPDRPRLHVTSDVAVLGGEWRGGGTTERIRLAVEPGDTFAFAALLWCDEAAGTGLRLEKQDDGWRIGETVVTLTAQGLRVRAEDFAIAFPDDGTPVANKPLRLLPLRTSGADTPFAGWQCRVSDQPVTAVAGEAGHGWVAGSADGWVAAFDCTGRQRWRTRLMGAIRALEFFHDGVLAGGDQGALVYLGPNGEPIWAVELPWVTLPWAYWSEGRSRILEIAVADLDEDGAEEILVGNADRRVYAFDRAGRLRWKHAVEWGVFTAMWPARHEGAFALLGGTARPSIFGRLILLGGDGRLRGHFSRADLTCWSLPSGLRDLHRMEMGGETMTFAAVDTNCRQLIAYGANGRICWDADLAAGATALTVDTAGGRIFAASEAGYVTGFESVTGRRQWTTWLGGAASLLWGMPDGGLQAVMTDGLVVNLSAAGEVRSTMNLGSAITAVPRPGNHRGTGRKLVLGAADGRVLVI
ncbi:MAG: Heparinase N-terminus [Verrucomicrobiota bacterium]|jgi:outer membrane protein assembly factor BamB